jgi:asparaginyl-tRNA synthetase
MNRTKVKSLLAEKAIGQEICVKGWVRTRRGSKNIFFIAFSANKLLTFVLFIFYFCSFKFKVTLL